MYTSERLIELRKESLERINTPRVSPCVDNYTKAFFDIYQDKPLWERQARAYVYALLNEPMHVHPNELLAGQLYQAIPGGGCPLLGGSEDERWNEYAAYPTGMARTKVEMPENAIYGKYFCDNAYPGHITWDWGMMLAEGIVGMLKRIDTLDTDQCDQKAREFYAGARISLEGLLEWVASYVDLLESKAAEASDDLERAELLKQADILRRVPKNPANGFREALQSFMLQYLAVMFENPYGGNGQGRMDYYLWPYLEKDLAAGVMDLETARELIVEAFIKMDERIHVADGWVEAVMVGGYKPDGTLAINPLSYIMVETIMDLNQTHPSVYIRLPKGAPRDFVELSSSYIIHSGNRGQVYGDDAVIEALVADGTSIEDARNWGAGGCMEVSVQGAASDLLFTFAHNTSRTLELVLNGGRLLQTDDVLYPELKDLSEYQSFEELTTAFEQEFRKELGIMGRRIGIYEQQFAKYRPAFLISTMIHDCLEKGRSMLDGGARYPNFGGSCVGIPNVADSLHAIKKAVFDEKRYSGQEILDALRANFAGYEEMQAYLSRILRYGSGCEEATALVDWTLGIYKDSLKKCTTPSGGHGVPVVLGFVWVVDFGLQTGATPDGRRAGEPLAHGLTPQCGSAIDGITSAICDATSLSLNTLAGGASMMWDLDKEWADNSVLVPVLEAYIEQGGHIFQGNVVDIDVLLDAVEHPEKHGDLMVRVGGYSARFNTLSRATQTEIIERQKFKA